MLTPLSELGTDDAMAKNFATRVAGTGPLQDRLKTYLPLSLERFGSEAKGVEILRYAVTGVIFNGLLRDPSGTLDAVNAGRDFGEELIGKASDLDIAEAIADDFRMAGTVDSGPVQLVYKARPLNGIWATAPSAQRLRSHVAAVAVAERCPADDVPCRQPGVRSERRWVCR